jgi:hypothetical protein
MYVHTGIAAISEHGTAAANLSGRSLLGGGRVESPVKVDPKAQVGTGVSNVNACVRYVCACVYAGI